MAKYSDKGFFEPAKYFDKILTNGNKLNETEEISILELFNKGFLAENTQFSTFEEMINAYGEQLNLQDDLEKIDQASLDAFVLSISKFESFGKLLNGAKAEYLANKLGL